MVTDGPRESVEARSSITRGMKRAEIVDNHVSLGQEAQCKR
jgi:hypothetical protein